MFGVGGVDPNPGSHKLVGIDPSKESDKIYSQVADDTSSDVQVQRGSARSRSNSKVDSELSAEEKAEVSSLKYHLTSITNAHGIVAKRDFLKLIEVSCTAFTPRYPLCLVDCEVQRSMNYLN